jgi:hypothetical protein
MFEQFKKALVALTCLAFPVMATEGNVMPSEIYFHTAWCPSQEDLVELSKHLELTMNGCCVSKGVPKALARNKPEVLKRWRMVMSNRYSPQEPCTGIQPTAEEVGQMRLEYENFVKETDEQTRLDKERILKEAPKRLREMAADEFCAVLGDAIRGNWTESIGFTKDGAVLAMAEAARRKLSVNRNLVRAEKLQIGITECELYASWGLPETKNRTVGSWGYHTQHVYRSVGTYVYTKNGKVTGWQD